MTKEQYIEKLVNRLNVQKFLATKVFYAIYLCDVAVFCSYMADDIDHPEERITAKRVKESKLKEFDNGLVSKIESFMDEDEEYDIHKFSK